jgi:hypothetical protein
VTAMQQIADWLKELGMAGCAERFAEKHIDIGVLRDLTDQDLKDLSVVSIGHHRKMLRAISELAEARTVPPRPPPTSLSKSQDCAERRQLADTAALQLAAKPPSSVNGVGAGADGAPPVETSTPQPCDQVAEFRGGPPHLPAQLDGIKRVTVVLTPLA